MQYCPKCKVKVRGYKTECPLCQGRLTGTPESPAYPVLKKRVSRVSLLKILTFILAVIVIVMISARFLLVHQLICPAGRIPDIIILAGIVFCISTGNLHIKRLFFMQKNNCSAICVLKIIRKTRKIADENFKTVLDIGCGPCLQSKAFLDAGKKVTAIDSSPDKSGKFTANANFRRSTADFMEYDFNETFDCVWCSHCLEHQLDPQAFLKKAASLVKTGGGGAF